MTDTNDNSERESEAPGVEAKDVAAKKPAKKKASAEKTPAAKKAGGTKKATAAKTGGTATKAPPRQRTNRGIALKKELAAAAPEVAITPPPLNENAAEVAVVIKTLEVPKVSGEPTQPSGGEGAAPTAEASPTAVIAIPTVATTAPADPVSSAPAPRPAMDIPPASVPAKAPSPPAKSGRGFWGRGLLLLFLLIATGAYLLPLGEQRAESAIPTIANAAKAVQQAWSELTDGTQELMQGALQGVGLGNEDTATPANPFKPSVPDLAASAAMPATSPSPGEPVVAPMPSPLAEAQPPPTVAPFIAQAIPGSVATPPPPIVPSEPIPAPSERALEVVARLDSTAGGEAATPPPAAIKSPPSPAPEALVATTDRPSAMPAIPVPMPPPTTPSPPVATVGATLAPSRPNPTQEPSRPAAPSAPAAPAYPYALPGYAPAPQYYPWVYGQPGYPPYWGGYAPPAR